MGTCHAMGGHGWAHVVVDGYGLGMGTNSKEMLGPALDSLDVDERPPPIMKLVDTQHHAHLLATFIMDDSLEFTPTYAMKLQAI